MAIRESNLAEAYSYIEHYEELKARTNDTFFPLYFDQHRYLVLKGSAGSGKSIFAGDKVIERCLSEPGHKWLVVRKVKDTLKTSCFEQLVNQLSAHYPGLKIIPTESPMRIKLPNSSRIIFAGCDDPEKLKSIFGVTGIWIEEASELTESDFNLIDDRLRGDTVGYKQVILTFNPVAITHWLKKRFFDNPDEKTRTHHSTYLDNRFLDDEYRGLRESYKEIDPYHYAVYSLGEWGVTGKTVFPGQQVSEQLMKHIKPVRVGYFDFDYDGLRIDNIRFVDSKDGFIKIYQDTEPRRPYVIGGDTAGDGSDKFVAQVIDNITGEQVAVLRRDFDEDLYSQQVYCLGQYYNTALVAIEGNFSTYPIRELQRLRYKKQYVRERMDNYTHKLVQAFGFVTSSATRNPMISNLIEVVRDNIELINDETTLEEMLTFVRDEKFKPTAEEGSHDDCIMALAIAHFVRGQQKSYIEPESEEFKEWTQDMLEDYERASRPQREEMIKLWGRPKQIAN